MSKYEKWYGSVYEFISTHNLCNFIVALKKILTGVVALSYAILLLYCFKRTEFIWRVILVPLVTFLLVSVFRYFINADRPYTKYNIKTIIDKDTAGKSFPSRHTFSACIISMSWMYVYMPVGIVLLVITFMMGGIRVITGVHFPRDVIAAIVAGVLFGIIGFWII